MTDPITCVHIGRSTWQGPASAAPRKEDRMTHDLEAAERLAQCLESEAKVIGSGYSPRMQPMLDAAALIRAQAAEIERLRDRLPTPAEPAGGALREAAQAVMDRWDSSDWKAPATATYMNRLRAALAAAPAPIQPDVGAGIYGECAPFTVKNGTEMDPQPDADEREALVRVIEQAFAAPVDDGRSIALVATDALLAAGWTRKREEG